MKITDKQKELLIKMRDEKLDFQINEGLDYWNNTYDIWDRKDESNPHTKTSIKKLYDKGLLVLFGEPPSVNIYSLNRQHQTFINSL